MSRFFITGSNLFGGTAYVSKKDAEYFRMLKIGDGEIFSVCDANGKAYDFRMNVSPDGEKSADFIGYAESREPDVRCTVYLAYSDYDKVESAVKKCVELGAHAIVLFPSTHAPAPSPAKLFLYMRKWQNAAYASASDSFRKYVPKLYTAATFEDAVGRASQAAVPLFLYEKEHSLGLEDAFAEADKKSSISIMAGGTYGFTPDEMLYAKNAGMRSVSIGSRIVGYDTAPIAAITAVMLLTGNMSAPDKKEIPDSETEE